MKHDLLMVGPMYKPTQSVLEATYTTHKLWEAPDRDAFLASVAGRITAVASTGTRGVDDATMGKLPKLKVISHFGVGVDSVDVEAARRRGIAVTNTPDVLTEDVADIALALLLCAIRRVPQGDRYVREGHWLKAPMALTQSVQGRKVGIVGLGRIGKAIAKRCEAFNLEVEYHGRNRQAVAYPHHADVVSLARAVDILVVAAPGGDETRGLVGREALEALGPEGTIVNIARGSVIDEAAMIEALESGKLGAAGLDVFDKEPQVPAKLLAMDNVVVQPHVGSATHPTRTAMGQLVIDNLAAHFGGKALLTPV
ncbi:MAG TPA: 2-hydroxyacid dehydrogenase [Usitatibacter sp.]|jgi:lactate dehydrogenase-like 2-hydroxyacid dehydrogenase|nr:2-hydroxyacid dehydrogenase [Usitatibacter sp.]